MTRDEFLDALAEKNDDGWILYESPITHGKEIVRAADTSCCPFLWMPPKLGLSRDDKAAIFDAADDKPGHDPALRARLLAACGLASPASPEAASADAIKNKSTDRGGR